ncbi:Stalked cell differentiation-controlling protein [uncultured Eubacterium sp.]|nr:Stalked cell differentiation-controlling protein [uncultured Eubacterium sp.]
MKLDEVKEKVLVVDDNKINRAILSKILSSEYEILEAENGKAALEAMKEQQDIMAVLLDLRMPVMDGYEFLHVVRAEMHNDTLPIIAITAMEGDSSEIQALNLGADDYLVKPVVPSVVRKRLENAIRLQKALKQANHDMMTNLLNRSAFIDKVEKMLFEAEKDVKCAFFVIDLDNFKKANDTLGHTYGDHVLIDFSRKLIEMGNRKLIAGRLGGDEFTLFLYDYKDEEEVSRTAENCLAAMASLHTSKLNAAPTCSVGISLFPQDGHDVNKLYYMADQALYESKGLGKNRYTFYGSGKTVEEKFSRESREWILDEMDSYIYICDAETHEVYYANAKALNLLAGAKRGEPKCFCYLLGLSDKGFFFCSEMKLQAKTSTGKIVGSKKLGRDMFYRGKLINWDGRLARMAIVSEIKDD